MVRFSERDINAHDHASNNLKGCIYSPINKYVRCSSNIVVAIQSGLLDQYLERLDLKIQILVNQKYFDRGFDQVSD